MRPDLTAEALYSLEHTLAASLLRAVTYPWEALAGIRDCIRSLGPALSREEYDSPRPGVWIHKTARVFDSAYIGEDVILGAGTEVRHGAFIRGSALVGDGAVVGNSTELKNVILFDGVQVPHYNYVGDSILGFRAHMGAGAVTSNLKSDQTPVTVSCGDEKIETGLHKCGALVGDGAEIGCGAVLNPGTVIGRGARVYPLSMVRGIVPAESIYKRQGEIAAIRR